MEASKKTLEEKASFAGELAKLFMLPRRPEDTHTVVVASWSDDNGIKTGWLGLRSFMQKVSYAGALPKEEAAFLTAVTAALKSIGITRCAKGSGVFSFQTTTADGDLTIVKWAHRSDEAGTPPYLARLPDFNDANGMQNLRDSLGKVPSLGL